MKKRIVWIVVRSVERFFYEPISTFVARWRMWAWGATVGSGIKMTGWPRLRLLGSVTIGSKTRIHSGYANFVGGSQPTAILVLREGTLCIGDCCGLSNTTIVCRERIEILEGTFIGGGCRIYDNDFHQLDPDHRLTHRGIIPSAPIRIGPRAFVGGHCIILKGVTIGEGAVIGAGSVVTRNVPAFEIWGGAPARKIRELGAIDKVVDA